MTVECHPIVSREEWLTWRRAAVTASRVGALFDCSPYETALRLYTEHRGVEFEQPVENKAMRRGRWLERVVGEAVGELRPEWKIETVGAFYLDPELKLGGTPDFWILGDPRGRGVLQAKTVAPHIFARDWDGGTAVPEWISWQLRTEMMLTDATFGAVGALIVDPFNMDCIIFETVRDPAIDQQLTATVRKFWDNVARGIEPEPDYTRDAEVIRALTKHEQPGLVRDFTGDNQVPDLLAQRAALQAAMKEQKGRCEAIEAELMFMLGDAEAAAGIPGWRITYKTENVKEYTVPARSSRVLRIRPKKEEVP